MSFIRVPASDKSYKFWSKSGFTNTSKESRLYIFYDVLLPHERIINIKIYSNTNIELFTKIPNLNTEYVYEIKFDNGESKKKWMDENLGPTNNQIAKLNDRMVLLEYKMNEMMDMIKYIPGGHEYHMAKKDFNRLTSISGCEASLSEQGSPRAKREITESN